VFTAFTTSTKKRGAARKNLKRRCRLESLEMRSLMTASPMAPVADLHLPAAPVAAEYRLDQAGAARPFSPGVRVGSPAVVTQPISGPATGVVSTKLAPDLADKAITGLLAEAAPRPAAANAVATRAAFDDMYTVSVVAIQNKTSSPVTYQIMWPGAGWKSFTVQPGKTMLHWYEGTGLKATIRYDKSFQTGYQEQRYALATKDFLAGGFAGFTPKKATHGEGYYFTRNSGNTGLLMYRGR
jgi:hypothetical protein